MTDLLLIDANQDRSSSLAEQLASQGIQVKEAAELGNLALGQFDCLLLDRAALPSDLSAVTEQLPVVVMADDGDVADAVRTMHLGVKDYLLRPIKIDELMAAIERACAYPPNTASVSAAGMELIGSSENTQTLRKRIEKVGPSDSPVLILGQSGR